MNAYIDLVGAAIVGCVVVAILCLAGLVEWGGRVAQTARLRLARARRLSRVRLRASNHSLYGVRVSTAGLAVECEACATADEVQALADLVEPEEEALFI